MTDSKALNSLADLICRAQKQGRRTPMGIAMAIESAQRHMTPETAAELDRLQVERDRYRTAWRMARTRALATGGAADMYAARAREGQTALQDMLASLLTMQIERDEARARVDEVERKYTFDTAALKKRVAELEAEQGNNDGAKAPWGRAEDGRPYLPEGAHWTDVPELVDRTVAGIQARVDQAQPGHWYTAPATETGLAPGTVRTRVDGYPRTVGQFTNVLPADLELILHAHDDLSWCLEMLAKFRARAAELEAADDGAPPQVVPVAVDVPVPVVLTEQDGPAVVTSAALAAANKLRRTLALPGGERS
ncbi:hypothetical protein AB0L49_02530 [Streptomyces antimycoticus]|uniref:hypothetical protein n=1 Tax=Streptomyces antimycoticus TaxID=68175 RepID=UPI003428E0FB